MNPYIMDALSKFKNILSETVTGIRYASNIVVLKTYAGMAQGACTALDSMFGNLMLGTLAGDDTILIVARKPEEIPLLIDKLESSTIKDILVVAGCKILSDEVAGSLIIADNVSRAHHYIAMIRLVIKLHRTLHKSHFHLCV